MSGDIRKDIENVDHDLAELSSLEVLAKRPNIKEFLATELKRLTQIKNKYLAELKEHPEDHHRVESHPEHMPGVGTVVVTNYMWDQTNEFVKIYIEIDKNYSLAFNQIHMNFRDKRNFSVIFGKFRFSLSKLFADIDPEKSYHKMTKSGKLIIYLKKASVKNWPSINETENKYQKALEVEEKDDLSGDPSAGLMKLMKQMYDEGDDEMKRTISKSWYESQQKKYTNDIDLGANDIDLPKI